MSVITEDQVVAFFRDHLRLKVRRIIIENDREETIAEAEELHDAMEMFDTIQLQYEAQFAR